MAMKSQLVQTRVYVHIIPNFGDGRSVAVNRGLSSDRSYRHTDKNMRSSYFLFFVDSLPNEESSRVLAIIQDSLLNSQIRSMNT